MAASGFDVTVDEVAQAAGVSRRTVFRHFATHGELIASAIDEIWRLYDDGVPARPPPGTDVRLWLEESAQTMHGLNRELIGRAFWDVHVARPGAAPEVVAALSDWASRRYALATDRAGGCWSALGGKGPTPPWVIDAFVLQLSTFATNAMAHYDIRTCGQVTARILWAVFTSALEDRR